MTTYISLCIMSVKYLYKVYTFKYMQRQQAKVSEVKRVLHQTGRRNAGYPIRYTESLGEQV